MNKVPFWIVLTIYILLLIYTFGVHEPYIKTLGLPWTTYMIVSISPFVAGVILVVIWDTIAEFKHIPKL